MENSEIEKDRDGWRVEGNCKKGGLGKLMPKYDIRTEKYPNVCYCIRVLGTRTLMALYPSNDPQLTFLFSSFKAIVRFSCSGLWPERCGFILLWMPQQQESHVERDKFSSTGRMPNLCYTLSRACTAKTRSEIVSNSWSSSDLSGVDRVCQSLERVAKNNSRHRGKQISPLTRRAAWRQVEKLEERRGKGEFPPLSALKLDECDYLPRTDENIS